MRGYLGPRCRACDRPLVPTSTINGCGACTQQAVAGLRRKARRRATLRILVLAALLAALCFCQP